MAAAAAAPAHAPAATPKAGGGKKKVLMIVVALASVGGGAAVPMLLASQGGDGEKASKKKHSEHPPVNVPFGEVTVNLAEDRMARFLRVKIVLKVEGVHEEEEAAKLFAPYKPAMKSWLISHLAGKSLKDVAGTVGVKRLQREILERFAEMLAPDDEGHSSSKVSLHLKDVLFEEYIVQ